MRRYKSASKLGKVFLGLSLCLVIAFVYTYFREVKQALHMNPASYNCTSDGMMKQLCHHPYSASILWSVLDFGLLFWPLIVIWAIIGTVSLRRTSDTSHPESKSSDQVLL